MTLESVETSSKSFIIIINFIVKSIRNQHLVLTMYPKIAKVRWMLLFGNNLNKFTYNNFITEIICNNHTRGYYYGNL